MVILVINDPESIVPNEKMDEDLPDMLDLLPFKKTFRSL